MEIRSIRINDYKTVRIFDGINTRGPIGPINVTTEQLRIVLQSMDAPRNVFIINPETKEEIQATLDNYNKPMDELFHKEEVVVVDEPVVPEVESIKIEVTDEVPTEDVENADIVVDVPDNTIVTEIADSDDIAVTDTADSDDIVVTIDDIKIDDAPKAIASKTSRPKNRK